MTEDKDLVKNLEYLDSILYYFIVSKTEYTADLISLSNDIFRLKLEKKLETFPEPKTTDELFASVFSPDNNEALFYKVRASIHYLVDKGYIFTSDNYNLKITYKGILKYSEGFVNEYKKHSDDKTRLLGVETFQNKISSRMLVTNILIAVSTAVAAIYYVLEIFSLHICFCK